MIGQMLGPYRILRELGSGGMGTVYLADDTRLGRKVALKVLPPETASHPERLARFQREARAVAGLNHPNIVVLHSVETVDGLTFITMEHVEGQPLSAFIPPGGMSLPDFFRVSIPLADAIHFAHKQGITHRDLKPDNVMITGEGRVKVLDFGLAKLIQTETQGIEQATMVVDDLATGEGKILGTPAYMSPEQAEGKPLDARTDIFSLGVMLYEMITGERPFQGETKMSTLSAVLTAHPPVITERKAGLPTHLARIIQRSLAKDPDRRYQTALDVRNELESLQAELQSGQIPVAPPPPSGLQTPYPTPPTPQPTTPRPTPDPAATSSPTPAPGPGTAPGPSREASSPGRPAWMLPGLVGIGALVIAAALYFGLRGGGPGAETDTARSGGAAVENASRTGVAKSIAVLPFANLGPPEDAYFAAGITDEIMGRLASVDALSVVSRTTVFGYDPAGKSMRRIGEELGVDYVLEGTVRWEKLAGGHSRVRVASNLVRTADDTQLWSERYERSMEEIFRIQSDVAAQVVQELGFTLLEPARLALGVRPTDNLDAYHAYLRAYEHLNAPDITQELTRTAIELLQRAVELDPEFALAWSDLCRSHAAMLHHNYDRTGARLQLAQAALDRVETLAPGSPAAHLARGYYHYWGKKEFEPALAAFEEVRRDLPGNVDVLEAIGFVRRRQGQFRSALEILIEAQDRDPQNPRLLYSVAETYALLGDLDPGLKFADRLIGLVPDASGGFIARYWNLTARGEFEPALDIVGPASAGNRQFELLLRFFGLWHLGRFDEAAEVAQELPDYSPDQFAIMSGPLLAGLALAMGHEGQVAAPHLKKAEAVFTERTAKPDAESHEWIGLALAQAAQGRRDAAAAAVETALAAYPADTDAWIRAEMEANVVVVHLLLGEAEKAIDVIADLQKRKGTYVCQPGAVLRSAVYAPLRGHPRFGEISGPAS